VQCARALNRYVSRICRDDGSPGSAEHRATNTGREPAEKRKMRREEGVVTRRAGPSPSPDSSCRVLLQR